MIYYWKDALQQGIYLSNSFTPLPNGGEIRDTKALNLSCNIVSLQVLGRWFAFSPRVIILICRATKTSVAGWRNAARWLVVLLGADPRQVASLIKNQQQSQNLLLKVDPRSTFRNNFLQPATRIFVARQVGHARWITGNIGQDLQRNNVTWQVEGFFVSYFAALTHSFTRSKERSQMQLYVFGSHSVMFLLQRKRNNAFQTCHACNIITHKLTCC